MWIGGGDGGGGARERVRNTNLESVKSTPCGMLFPRREQHSVMNQTVNNNWGRVKFIVCQVLFLISFTKNVVPDAGTIFYSS